MRSDRNGCSTCPRGQESYETYRGSDRKPRVQYDFRTQDGRLFSCTAPSVEVARKNRDHWAAALKPLDEVEA